MNIICSGQVASEKDLSLLEAQVVVFEMSHFCPLQLNGSWSLLVLCVFRYKKLEDLLEKSFSLVKMPSIQPVVMCVMKHLPKVKLLLRLACSVVSLVACAVTSLLYDFSWLCCWLDCRLQLQMLCKHQCN